MEPYKAKSVRMIGYNGQEEDVVPARERILELKRSGAAYNVQTEYYEVMGATLCRARVEIFDSRVATLVTGHSRVKPDEIGAWEAAETRAIGRALAAFGIGIESNFATAEEFPANIPGTVTENPMSPVKETMRSLEVVMARSAGIPIISEQPAPPETPEPKTEIAPPTPAEPPKRASRKTRVVTPAGVIESEAPSVSDNVPGNDPEPAENAKIDSMTDINPENPTEDDPNNWFTKPSAKKEEVIPDPVEMPAIEPPTLPAQPAMENGVGDTGNKYGIEIPPLPENGVRSFESYAPVLASMAMKGFPPDDVPIYMDKAGINKYKPEGGHMAWEVLFAKATVEEINAVLNAR